MTELWLAFMRCTHVGPQTCHVFRGWVGPLSANFNSRHVINVRLARAYWNKFSALISCARARYGRDSNVNFEWVHRIKARGVLMNGRTERWLTSIGWFAATLGLVGCGQDAPPYEDLPLRDALRASPEVVASLSLDTRRELAVRLDAAAIEQECETPLAPPDTTTIEALARVADEAREDDDLDALVLGELTSQAADIVLRADNKDATVVDSVIVGPIFLRGRSVGATAVYEEAALGGRAGKWLRELSRRTKTSNMVRTTGVPFGAWSYGDTLYVNASWLVAMSALEEGVVAPIAGNAWPVMAAEPGKVPLTVDFNPYKLPGSITECALQVEETCKCGTSCTQDVTDPSFGSANEECAWVNSNATHSVALCILALMAVEDVQACMANAPGECRFVSNRDDAVTFLQNPDCIDSLDRCLQDGSLPRPTTGSSGSGCSGCNTCSNSSSGNSCSKCSDDCSKCNDNWSQCNQNCKDCNQNCTDTNQNAKSCGKCSVKPDLGQSPLPTPVGNGFWMLAPLAYVLWRGRRRS